MSAGSAPTTTATGAGPRASCRCPAPRARGRRRSSPIPNPMPGRRPPAEQLDEAVVAAAAAERLLLALARRRRRTRTPSACSSRGRGRGPGSSRYGTPSASRCARTPAKCVGARVAQVVGDARRGGVERGHRRVLRIEQAQRRSRSSRSRSSRRQRVGVVAEVGRQLRDVGRPAGRVADRVEQHLDAGRARRRGRTASPSSMISASTAGPGSPIASTSNCQNWR